MELAFCERLPKLELHAHLNGSLSLETLKELYDMHKADGSGKVSDWDSSEFVKDSYSLNSFFGLFKTTYALTSTPEAVMLATERVIEDFAKDNVIYLELRSTLRKEENMTKRQYLESMINGIIHCREKCPNISVKLLISINRAQALESSEENVNLAIEYMGLYPDIIVGIDVSGNPTDHKFSDFVKGLDQARSKGLKVSVHCAEVNGKEEVRQILEFHPHRIGHGTCIHMSYGGNSKLWKTLLDKKIPVELCLTSNIKCNTISNFESHHFKVLYDERHPVAICTDDKGCFDTTLSREFSLIQNTFGLSNEELWKLSYESINYIFGDEKEKESLRTMLMQWKMGNL